MDHEAFIQAYLDSELTEPQQAELRDWLAQSEANREAFVRASIFDTQIHRQLQHADLHRFLDQVDIHAIQDVIDQCPGDGSGVFAAAMDDESQQASSPRPELELGRALGILSRAGFQYAHQKARQYAVPLGVAAGVGVAVVLTLLFVFQGDNAPNQLESTADTAQTPETIVAPTPLEVVATLTATHNAAWSPNSAERASARGSALRPGTKLHANQRLTLTAGFAEITTARGAVVILEAPATVELTDQNNAIRLHAGKLVGICETDSSKGFLVRTPHMDVVDLGTRFGVAADDQTSGISVIEGEVKASSSLSGSDAAPTHLSAGQAALVDVNLGQVVPSNDLPDRFTNHWQAIVGEPVLTGPILYEPSIPSDLRVGANEDEEIRLFHERSDVLLKDAVEVNMIAPGRYEAADLLKATTLKDLYVDSYFVHYDSPDNTGTTARQTITIRFDRPIVGVIVTGEQLAASHDLLGIPGVAYGNESKKYTAENIDSRDGSGLDIAITSSNKDHLDIVQLSDDRRTLTLELTLQKEIDQVRVLVQSQKDQDQ